MATVAPTATDRGIINKFNKILILAPITLKYKAHFCFPYIRINALLATPNNFPIYPRPILTI